MAARAALEALARVAPIFNTAGTTAFSLTGDTFQTDVVVSGASGLSGTGGAGGNGPVTGGDGGNGGDSLSPGVAEGGAVFNQGGDLTITAGTFPASLFTNNQATTGAGSKGGDGGAGGNGGLFGGNGGSGGSGGSGVLTQGGAVAVVTGNLTISSTTFGGAGGQAGQPGDRRRGRRQRRGRRRRDRRPP